MDTVTVSDKAYGEGLAGKFAVKKMDEILLKDGTYHTRTATGVKRDRWTGFPVAEKYRATDYTTKEDYSRHYAQDPEQLTPHIYSEETLSQMTAPVYDADEKVYRYKVSLDVVLGTTVYEKYVLAMMSGINGEVEFLSIDFEVEQWDNGLFKQISVTERYLIKKIIMLGTMALDMNALTYYNYDSSEKDYQIDTFKKSFGI